MKKIVAGNWKMNLSVNEAAALSLEIAQLEKASDVQVYLFPPMLAITACQQNAPNLTFGAQNGYFKDAGAFTGEVSMKQLKQAGVQAVLIGHSERRMYFSESNEMLKNKVDAALNNELTPFFCCGEPLEIREAKTHFSFVKQQLEESLFHLDENTVKQVVIAYEPIWAIGTGKTASTEQAEEMHQAIRSWLKERYSEECAASISILYGGSCNPSNAKALFACPNVNGGLIGGASLNAADFSVLIAKETWTI